MALDPDISRYYALGRERDRLSSPGRGIEFVRTREILARHLPPPPGLLLDVGGGPGRYAHALAGDGYRVALVDPVPLHVRQAREDAPPGCHCLLADARGLPFPDGSADAVLLLGPLYHLPRREDRLRTWREAGRVLRPGGVLVAAGLSRFYSSWDMLASGKLDLPGVEETVAAHVSTGEHRNQGRDYERLFTTAYLHAPDELAEEAVEAGLRVRALLAVEGPAKLLGDIDARMEDERRRDQLLRTLRRLEAEPSVLGLSQHHLVVATAGD
ncbi:hypothetical protein GCM10009801_10210 [Streptomyces albiaxialis]|uniref:Methyltransferase type 11 domain-containing protein n=1 Tax=Streptomyces albiaxialis TaxID=329523 RepID=A0ABN2VL78_9ACTN